MKGIVDPSNRTRQRKASKERKKLVKPAKKKKERQLQIHQRELSLFTQIPRLDHPMIVSDDDNLSSDASSGQYGKTICNL